MRVTLLKVLPQSEKRLGSISKMLKVDYVEYFKDNKCI